MRVPTEGGTVDTCWSSGETKFLSSLPVKQSQECLQVIHLLLLCQWGHWDNRGGTFVYHWSFLSNQSLAMHCSQSRNFYKIQKQCLLISNQLWRSERARHQIAQWCTSWKPEQCDVSSRKILRILFLAGWLFGWQSRKVWQDDWGWRWFVKGVTLSGEKLWSLAELPSVWIHNDLNRSFNASFSNFID